MSDGAPQVGRGDRGTKLKFLPKDPWLSCVPTALAALEWERWTIDDVCRACVAHCEEDEAWFKRGAVMLRNIQATMASLDMSTETIHLTELLGGTDKPLSITDAVAKFPESGLLFLVVENLEEDTDLHALAIIDEPDEAGGGLQVVDRMKCLGATWMYTASGYQWFEGAVVVCVARVGRGGLNLSDPHWTTYDEDEPSMYGGHGWGLDTPPET